MKTMMALAGAALAMALATPAAASLSVFDYHGTVAAVFGLDPVGVMAGDDVEVRFRADTSVVTDVTAATNAFFGTSYNKVQVASLTAPGDYLHVRVGSQPITGAFNGDQQNPFWPDPFAAGGSPYVLFINSAFAGVDFFGINPSLAAFVTKGAAPETFDFVGGSVKVGGPSYGGFFDYSTLRVTAGAPEPAAWALMIGGFGLAGAALRRRRAAAA